MPTKYRAATAVETAAAERINFWSTPSRNQGQAVEVSYSAGPHMRKAYECDIGETWRRTVDRSDGTTSYAILA
jgi:hypothetical protein